MEDQGSRIDALYAAYLNDEDSIDDSQLPPIFEPMHGDDNDDQQNEPNLEQQQLEHVTSLDPHTLMPHECKECGKRFRLRSKLKIHSIKHTPATHKPYTCDICGKSFRYSNYLGVHQRLHDTTVRPYKCKYCTQHFHSLHKRRLHMTAEHLEVKTFLCSLCPSVLTSECLLRDHIKRHRNQRDFPCDACNKRFYSRRQLQDHQHGVHANLRPHECETCKMRFQRKSHYTQHMKLHASAKTYGCTLCAKTFAQKAGLFMHMRTHRQQRQELCD